MFRIFEGRTANDAWQSVATAFGAGGGISAQASRNGATHEIIHAAISVSDPHQRWAVSRQPAMNVAFALAEVIWIMAGRNDSAFLNYYNNGLPKFCGTGPTYHGAYGHRLRKRFNIDQVMRAYEALHQNPESRQVVMQIWDSTVDLPNANGKPSAEDVPCNVVAMLKVRNKALEWTQIMRSNDVYRGLPYNFVQFTSLQEIIAGWLGLDVGTYNHVSDSLHVYERDLDKIKSARLLPVEPNTDKLAMSKEEFDPVFQKLEREADSIIDAQIDAEFIADKVVDCPLPAAYRNILCVLCAEGVRRRKREEYIDKIMANCTNLAYTQLYTRWLSRMRRKN